MLGGRFEYRLVSCRPVSLWPGRHQSLHLDMAHHHYNSLCLIRVHLTQALTPILISGYLSGLLRPPPVPGGHPGGHPGPPPLAPPPPSPGPRPPIIGGLPGYSAPGECLSVWRGGKLEKYNCVFSHRAPETRGLSCVKIELFVLVTLYRLTK